MNKLSPRQKEFLKHYSTTFNPVEAWKAAGLKVTEGLTVQASATTFLCTEEARSELLELRNALTATVDEETAGAEVISELKKIAFSKITDVCHWDASGNVAFFESNQLEPETQSAIETMRIEMTQFGPKIMVKMHSKQSALATLAHYYNVDVDMNSLLARVRSYDYEAVDLTAPED